jgi:hypothetical protein
MTAPKLAAICAASMALAACGSVGPDWGFDESVDWDVGAGSTYGDSDDAGAGAIDPCADPAALACDPLTNAECDADAGYACSYYADDPGGSGAFACLSESTAAEGAACDADDGPWCGPALACVPGDGTPGLCAPLCCADDDCGAPGAICDPLGYPEVEGALGACTAPSPDGGVGE